MDKGSIVGRSRTSHSCAVKVLWMKTAASDEMPEILHNKTCEAFFAYN